MLRRIFAAIIAGLRSIGRMVGRAAAVPFRMFDQWFGGNGSDLSQVPEVSAEHDDVPAPAEDQRHLYEQAALAVMQWCVDSLAADAPAADPVEDAEDDRGVAAWPDPRGMHFAGLRR
jgi:hypothetical protein